MGKIAIVGVEGSGKTVLMAALSECYQRTSDSEPYLMAENQSAFVFMEQVPHKLRVAREWPAATGMSGLKTLKWTLRLGEEVLKEVEMLDYPASSIVSPLATTQKPRSLLTVPRSTNSAVTLPMPKCSPFSIMKD